MLICSNVGFDSLEFIECSFLVVNTVDGHSQYFFWFEHRQAVDVGIDHHARS